MSHFFSEKDFEWLRSLLTDDINRAYTHKSVEMLKKINEVLNELHQYKPQNDVPGKCVVERGNNPNQPVQSDRITWDPVHGRVLFPPGTSSSGER